MTIEEELKQLKEQDKEIRALLGKVDASLAPNKNEKTAVAVDRALNALVGTITRERMSWSDGVRKLIKEFGFTWGLTPFEVPLAEAWRKDRQQIAELKAENAELKKSDSA